jgi:hypothetical protein
MEVDASMHTKSGEDHLTPLDYDRDLTIQSHSPWFNDLFNGYHIVPIMSKKASKANKRNGDEAKAAPTHQSDMPEGEKFNEKLKFRKVDPWGGLYFTPLSRDQYDRLKKQAVARHPLASVPVFYDNFDDIITVRAKGSKDGWNEGHRLKKDEEYVVHGMMKTAVVKGHPSTFIRIQSVDGDLTSLKKDKKKKKKAEVKVDVEEEEDEEEEDENEEEEEDDQ